MIWIWIETKNCNCESQVLLSKINFCHCVFWDHTDFRYGWVAYGRSISSSIAFLDFHSKYLGVCFPNSGYVSKFLFTHFISEFAGFVLECCCNLFRDQWNLCCFLWMYVIQKVPVLKLCEKYLDTRFRKLFVLSFSLYLFSDHKSQVFMVERAKKSTVICWVFLVVWTVHELNGRLTSVAPTR